MSTPVAPGKVIAAACTGVCTLAVLAGVAPNLQQGAIPRSQHLPIGASLTLKDPFGRVERIALEVARTKAEQRIGLMGRPDLPAGRGMLFLFEPARVQRFWMKDTLVPLDMVFLRGGKILAIVHEAAPCQQKKDCPHYGPSIPVDSVLELKGDSARRAGLQAGRLLKDALHITRNAR